jgi:GxxExxY protein
MLTVDTANELVVPLVDLLVEDKVVIETKTVEAFTDVHTAQILTYMRLGNYKLGLLLNFHVKIMKDGIKRVGTVLKSV